MQEKVYGLILSAGWATRLRPLSFYRPKVLLPIGTKTLLDHWVEKLDECESIFVNGHALYPLLKEYLQPFKKIELLYEPVILGSGGSIYNTAKQLSSGWIIVVNGDMFLSEPPPKPCIVLEDMEPSICLLLQNAQDYNNVVVSPEGQIIRFRQPLLKPDEAERGYKVLAFAGIQFIHTDIIKQYSRLFSGIFLDIIEIYNKMIELGLPIRYRLLKGCRSFDMGTPQRYFRLCKDLGFIPSVPQNSRISKRALVNNTIIWDRVQVEAGCTLDSCIVTDGVRLREGSYRRKIITHHRIWNY